MEHGWQFMRNYGIGSEVSHNGNQILFEAIIDSQSVKTAAMLNQSVGYDAGKKIKGRKRFLTVDTLGLILSVFVTAASQTEREGGKVVLERLKEKGTRIARLHTIWVDGGFTGDTFMMWVMDLCH
jgi:Transposase DDE domain